MLRVYSVLYLQQVWERPALSSVSPQKSVVNAEIIINNDDITIADQNEIIATTTNTTTNEVEEESCYGTVNIVSSLSVASSQNNSTATITSISESLAEIVQEPSQQQAKEDKEIIQFDEIISCSNSSNNSINGKANSLTSLPVVPPSRSETPLTQHHEEEEEEKITISTSSSSNNKNKVLILDNSEFYEDEISSDTEEEESIKQPQQEELLPTPPSTPTMGGSKFSPKRILHRAKSSIQDEHVKKIGRRTSLFLEKFNQLHQQQQPSSVSPLPPINATPSQNTKNGNIKEDFSKGLRRQSSKLTGKGKSLTKKLKRVLSFHHQPTTTFT